MMTHVWTSFPRGGSHLLVMLALADFASDDGENIRPSMTTIARKCRLSRSQAQRVVHELVGMGVLAVTGNHDGGAPGSTRRYRIVVTAHEAQTGGADATPTGRTDATGSVEATRRTGAIGRVAPMHKTGRIGATQSIMNHQEPSFNAPSVHLSPNGSATGKLNGSRIPHIEIVGLYHEILPMATPCKSWRAPRQALLRARWREDPARQTLDWWVRYFGYVAESEFLCGRANGSGREPFQLTLEWLLRPSNFDKVREGYYHRSNGDHQ